MIGIIDYRMGNLRSVQKAFEHLGARADLLTSPRELGPIDRLVLPGVGAFADGMVQLDELGWIEPIGRFVRSGRPFLGICLGLQLLFEDSQEGGPSPDEPVGGLAILPGHVVHFEGPMFKCRGSIMEAERSASRLKVPHMGWNSITWTRDDPLLRGVVQNAAVYFVHSYYPVSHETPGEPIVSATVDYGGAFCASIWRDNIWATQFHPEKSQRVGLKMLKNFASV